MLLLPCLPSLAANICNITCLAYPLSPFLMFHRSKPSSWLRPLRPNATPSRSLPLNSMRPRQAVLLAHWPFPSPMPSLATSAAPSTTSNALAKSRARRALLPLRLPLPHGLVLPASTLEIASNAIVQPETMYCNATAATRSTMPHARENQARPPMPQLLPHPNPTPGCATLAL